MDLIDDAPEGGNAPEFTVSELSGAIKRTLEGGFGHVRVRAEVGRVSRPRSGHVYLDLKDDRAVISGVIWKGTAARLDTQPEEGMEVIATGRITTFPGQSKYQIVIEDIRPAGMGALMAMLEKRKAQLAAEGLFEAGRKQPLPYLPRIIGVVTSPSGAVIRDILHRLRDRFPRKVLIWPVAVQGAACAPEVARAIAGFNALSPGGALPRPDLLIVARGGGSVEDLWGFNEEVVVRAAAASRIPLISAVGHETDTTLIDFAADRRAPTPTAAAELAVPVRLELLAWVDGQGARLSRCSAQAIVQRRQRLGDLSRGLPRPAQLLDGPRQRLDIQAERLPGALRRGVERRRLHLTEAASALRPRLLRQMIASDRRSLAECGRQLLPRLQTALRRNRAEFDRLAPRLRTERLPAQVEARRADLDRLSGRLSVCGQAHLQRLRDRLQAADRLRETLGYKATLRRGYAVVRGGGEVVTREADARRHPLLEIEFADGRVEAAPGPARRRARPADPPPGQGSLL